MALPRKSHHGLELRNVSKRFTLERRPRMSLASALPLPGRSGPRSEELLALRDVSLTIHAGETLGIIGPNGAGKSTLLSLLAGTLVADSGEVVRHCSVAPLIDVGLGFQPELSGEENVHLGAALFGLSRQEILAKLPAIVDFAGLGHVMDVPVRSYSTGMVARLGFALATHVGAGALLVDEVLAVGDREFRGKCLARIDELRDAGTAIVLVSHDLDTIAAVCSRVCLLEHGRITAIGPGREVVERYRSGPDSRQTASGQLQGTGKPARL